MNTGTRRVRAEFSRVAAPSEGGVSFLEFLAARFPYHTRKEWTARILDGRVLLEKRPAGPETRVERGMRVEYRVDDYAEPAVPLNFRELVCRNDLALVHKPPGLPVHKTGRIFVHVLANLYRDFKGDAAWSPLNRLDVETGGIVAFARGSDATRRFSPGNRTARWFKTYLAVTEGTPAEESVLDGPLCDVPGDVIRTRMHVHPGGKPARTLYRTLASRDGKGLVLLRPVSGRKHQIRAHLAWAGFPVAGDKIYGHGGRFYLKRLHGELDADDLSVLGAPHQLLHAAALAIRDTEDKGIEGVDLDLPEGFPRYFPEATPAWLAERIAAGFIL